MLPGAGSYLFYVSERYALAVLRPLQREILAAGGQCAWFFDGPGAEYRRAGERRLETVAQVREFDPQAVFVPGNLVPSFFPGVKVELFHGFSVGKRSESRGHFRIRGLFDLYCTQGPTTTEPFRQLARKHGHFHVTETGWPKIDPLFTDDAAGMARWTEGWDDGRPVVLMASTFTSSLSAAPHLLSTVRELRDRREWRWLITLHPKMPAEIVRAYRALENEDLRFAETDDVVPLLQAADAMLCDTSSILHEFLLQRKPVVTLRNALPGPFLLDVQQPEQVEAALRRALQRPPELMEEIRRFGERIHPYRDGGSSRRVLEATHDFLARRQPDLRRKPLNLWRRFQMRRRLGYWGVLIP